MRVCIQDENQLSAKLVIRSMHRVTLLVNTFSGRYVSEIAIYQSNHIALLWTPLASVVQWVGSPQDSAIEGTGACVRDRSNVSEAIQPKKVRYHSRAGFCKIARGRVAHSLISTGSLVISHDGFKIAQGH